jgi:small subunit ribosomal protein S20
LAQHKSAKKRARRTSPGANAIERSAAAQDRREVRARRARRHRWRGLEPAIRSAEREIRKAASKGVLTKKQASRRVSRLAKRLHATTAQA